MAGFDGYYRMQRDPAWEPRFYKMFGGHQWQLEAGTWVELGREGTYKAEPAWWVLTGEEGFERITNADLPADAPESRDLDAELAHDR